MKCKRCGSMIPNGTNACPNCGTPVPRKNTAAVIGFIFGIVGLLLCWIPLLGLLGVITGLVLSLIGVTKKNASSKGMAIAGISLSSVGILIGIIITGATFTSSSTSKNTNVTTNSAIVNATETKTETKKAEKIEYTHYDVSEMVNDLNTNAMKAQNKYKGKYIEITGKLKGIDSDGKYITLIPSDEEFAFTDVLCYLKNAEQKNVIMEMKKDDIVTLCGKCTDCGEVLGYYLDIDDINSIDR